MHEIKLQLNLLINRLHIVYEEDSSEFEETHFLGNKTFKKEINRHYTLRKKRYKSSHWGCTFSKGTLLYPKAEYWYLTGT